MATALKDMFPAEKFPGWALSRRPQMPFDGLSGVASLDSAEVRRVASYVTSDSALGRVSAVVLMHHVEGHLQILESITTACVAVTAKRGALHVDKVYRYLSRVAEDLSERQFVPCIHWKVISSQ